MANGSSMLPGKVASSKQQESFSILAVEDHTVFAREIEAALPGHLIVFARTMEEARQRYDETKPDITLLDIGLPDGNGIELIDYIRSKDPGAYIVMLTGSKFKEDIEASRGKGVDGYIIKPFARRRIERAIDAYREARYARQQGIGLGLHLLQRKQELEQEKS